MFLTSCDSGTNNLDSELDSQNNDSTLQEEESINTNKEAVIDGEVIGEWHEEKYTSSNYVIYKKDNKIFIKTIYKNGQTSDDELKELKVKDGIRYEYSEGGYNGEYFVLNSKGELEFYSSDNKNFTTAIIISDKSKNF